MYYFFDIILYVYSYDVICRLFVYIFGVYNAVFFCGVGQFGGFVSVLDCGGVSFVSMGSFFGGILCYFWYYLI